MSTKLITVWIIQELECFPESHRSPEEHEEKTHSVEPVLGLPPENELEIKGVELCDEEHDDETEHSQPTLQGGQGIPGELNPRVRTGKIKKESRLNKTKTKSMHVTLLWDSRRKIT